MRQLTYWQMKNRAGVIGEKGLGPFIGRLHDAEPDVRVNLVGIVSVRAWCLIRWRDFRLLNHRRSSR